MKLLKIEWLKLKHHRFFWIGMALYALSMVVLISQMGRFAPFDSKNNEGGMIAFQNLADAGLYSLPYIWQHITYLASFFKFIPAFLLIFFISNEYQYKTYRQNVIDGLSVGQYYISKIYSALIFTSVSLLIVAVTGFIMALQYNEDINWSTFLYGTDYLTAFFVEVLFIMVFTMFLTLVFKRSTITVIVILAYYFIAEPLLGLVLGQPVKSYLPTEPSRLLNLQPITRLLGADALLGNVTPSVASVKFMMVTLLYTLMLAAGGYFILKKRDL
jgi:hypothetical protein